MNKFPIFILLLTCFYQSANATLVNSGVEVSDLPSFSLNTLGINNQLDKDIWKQSASDELNLLIDKIGTSKLSPASQKALITLLTQETTVVNPSLSTDNENIFLYKRLEALFRLGAFNEVLSIIDLIPEKDITEKIKELQAKILLTKGELDPCLSLIEQMDATPFQDKMRINLFLEKEERNKAILAHEIYRENSDKDDPLFSTLADKVLLELDGQMDINTPLSSEHLFMLARLKDNPFDIQNEPIGHKKTLMNLPSYDVEKRISLSSGIALSLEELQSIYKLPLLDSKTNTDKINSVREFQKLKNENDVLEKSHLLNTFISSELSRKQLQDIIPLIEEELNQLPPQTEFIHLARNATLVYVLANNLEKAHAWYTTLKENTSDSYQKERLALIPLLQYLGAGIPEETESLLNYFCKDEHISECKSFWARASNDIYLHFNKQKTQPIIATPQPYMSSDNHSKKGENLIRAIFDLNNNEIQDKTAILSFIKENYPQAISQNLILEDLIYR